MTDAAFEAMITEVHRANTQFEANLLVQILHARVMNGLVQVLDAVLLELDPEELARLLKKGNGGDSDVRLLPGDPAEQQLQFEAHGADSVDPTIFCEDSNITLTEFPPINQSLKSAIQTRNEDLGDLGRR